jgi:serine phosphatase RsbU (regulator of sigma subunit)
LLRDIVTHQQITDPSDILYRLDEQMERILRNDSQPYEGMQAVVACINHPQKSIEIASAGNALWTVQNGQATQLPTAPVAIGNSTKAPKRFQKQFLKDIAGTMFYACTDGLTQLPQAENPTFFGQEALPKLLSQVAQQSAGQQKQTIEAAIAQWAGKAPRPDDLLLVGFGI